MAEVQIGLILSFLFLFILTRTVWVRVIKEERFRIELHLPLLALFLVNEEKDNKKQKKSKETDKLSARAYIRAIAGALARVKKCEVIIKRVVLPCKIEEFNGFSLVKPFGYQGLIYSLIAYLETKTQRLTLEDNAIISSPDIRNTQFYVTVKLSLFNLIFGLLALRRGINEEKRARRIRYVGE